HSYDGGVLAEALILVDDACANGVATRPVVVGAGGGGAGAAAGIGRTSQRAVVTGVGVVEASRRVGARRVQLAAEADRRGTALGHRPVVAQTRGRVDIGDGDTEGLAVVSAILVAHLDRDGVAAIVGVGVGLTERAHAGHVIDRVCAAVAPI